MAISKKEQAAIDAKIEALETMLALRFTQDYSPDIPPPTDKGMTKGYIPMSGSGRAYEKGVSSAVSHARTYSNDDWPKETSSQRPIKMYSTPLLALKALRRRVELEHAKDLHRIDKMIEKEETV